MDCAVPPQLKHELVERTPEGPRFKDLSGRTFGTLLVIRPLGFRGDNLLYLCRCECGSEKGFYSNVLRKIVSCGCKDRVRDASHPLRPIWRKMLDRCLNPDSSAFRDYGARGIGVCARWRKSFRAFVRDMGPRPSPKHTIDRIDNNLDYTPANCRWATAAEQSRNTRRNRWIEFNGERLTMSDWANRLGLTRERLRQRLAVQPLEQAMRPKVRGFDFRTGKDRLRRPLSGEATA